MWRNISTVEGTADAWPALRNEAQEAMDDGSWAEDVKAFLR